MARSSFFIMLLLTGCVSGRPKPAPQVKSPEATSAESPAQSVDDAFTQAFGSPKDDTYRQNVVFPDDDAFLKAESALKTLRAQVETALAARAWDEAQRKLAGWPQGVKPAERLELQTRLAIARNEVSAVVALARRWLDACGPEELRPCRLRALAALKSAGADIAALDAAEACLAEAEAARGALPCVESVHGAQDPVLRARAALVSAQGLMKTPRSRRLLAALDEARTSCDEARCDGLRREAARLATAVHLRSGDLRAAAREALRESRYLSQQRPPSERRHYATEQAERLCAQLAKRRGPSCVELEQELYGDSSYQDFSRTPGTRPFLSAPVLRSVAAHYQPTLQACVEESLSRSGKDLLRFTLSWVIRNDGRVVELHVQDGPGDEGPFADCVRRAAALWRYPRFSVDIQNVEQRFTVRSRPTRSVTPKDVAAGPARGG